MLIPSEPSPNCQRVRQRTVAVGWRIKVGCDAAWSSTSPCLHATTTTTPTKAEVPPAPATTQPNAAYRNTPLAHDDEQRVVHRGARGRVVLRGRSGVFRGGFLHRCVRARLWARRQGEVRHPLLYLFLQSPIQCKCAPSNTRPAARPRHAHATLTGSFLVVTRACGLPAMFPQQ